MRYRAAQLRERLARLIAPWLEQSWRTLPPLPRQPPGPVLTAAELDALLTEHYVKPIRAHRDQPIDPHLFAGMLGSEEVAATVRAMRGEPPC